MRQIAIIDECNLLEPTKTNQITDKSYELIFVRDIATLTAGIDPEKELVLDIKSNPSEQEQRYRILKRKFPQALVLALADRAHFMICYELYEKFPDLKASLPLPLLAYIQERLQEKETFLLKPSDQYVKATSPAMRKCYDELMLVAPTNFNVMIYGETGTGKEAIARLLHHMSPRRDMPFLALDCGCLNRETALSELYGHVKGAFTDALNEKTGAFELADGGTLFLDEIGNLTYDVQIALLRAIQEKKIRKIGTSVETVINTRIITATHELLTDEASRGTFRRDLYYRLNEMALFLPPLRDRKEDIAPLVQAFVEETCLQLKIPVKKVSEEALTFLSRHNWPGNIRELKNIIKRTCLLSGRSDPITVASLESQIELRQVLPATEAVEKEECLRETIQKAEYDQIMTALESSRYNKSKAASILNVHRKTLYNKLKQMKVSF